MNDKLNEEQVKKILDTPPRQLPLTKERKQELLRAKEILKKWKKKELKDND